MGQHQGCLADLGVCDIMTGGGQAGEGGRGKGGQSQAGAGSPRKGEQGQGQEGPGQKVSPLFRPPCVNPLCSPLASTPCVAPCVSPLCSPLALPHCPPFCVAPLCSPLVKPFCISPLCAASWCSPLARPLCVGPLVSALAVDEPPTLWPTLIGNQVYCRGHTIQSILSSGRLNWIGLNWRLAEYGSVWFQGERSRSRRETAGCHQGPLGRGHQAGAAAEAVCWRPHQDTPAGF